MVILTCSWLAVVVFLVLLMNSKEEEPLYRRFVDDFALMTSSAALIFVPYGFF
jgi:hypothetical protein